MKKALMRQKGHYDSVNRKINLSNADVYFNKRIEVLQKHIGVVEGRRILEVGCGDGIFMGYMKERFRKSEFYGADLSEGQIKKANLRIAKAGFVVSSAEHLSFMSDIFDVVVFNGVLHHVENVNAAIDEAVRVCKGSGIIMVIEPNTLNPLIFLLCLFKKHERGQFKLWMNGVRSRLKDQMSEIHVEPLNSLCYPYQKMPPKALFGIFNKLEDYPILFLNICTHFAIVAKNKKDPDKR